MMKKVSAGSFVAALFFAALATMAMVITSPMALAGEGPAKTAAVETTTATTQAGAGEAFWGLKVKVENGKVRFFFYLNPAQSVQRPGHRIVCDTYTPTGRRNAYERLRLPANLDLAGPGVDVGIDAKGLDRIEMERSGEGWYISQPVACEKVRTGFNVIFTFGRKGPFGRGKMTWLCFERSFRKGEGVIKYNDKALSAPELKAGNGPIAFASYETPDGQKDGFLVIKECE